jgi:hypothetical protein
MTGDALSLNHFFTDSKIAFGKRFGNCQLRKGKQSGRDDYSFSGIHAHVFTP